jgi:hypothetical protein
MQDLTIPYKRLSPDGPEHFPIVFAKIMQMWKTEPTLTIEQLATIASPSLIISADRDMITRLNIRWRCSVPYRIVNSTLCLAPTI